MSNPERCLMKLRLIVLSALLPVAAAQNAETCETILAALERTAAATASVTRTLSINAGGRELGRTVVRATQDENAIELTTLEQSGRQPPPREGDSGPDSSLLGLLPSPSCEGHALTETDRGYRLSLAVALGESPIDIDSVVLDVEQQGGRLVPLGYAAAGSVTQLVFTIPVSLNMSYKNWAFE